MIPQVNLLGELKKKKLFPLYLLLGEDAGAKDEFIRQLQDLIFKREEDKTLNMSIFHGDEAVTEDIIENCTTFSFLTDRKITIVHDFDRLKNQKLLFEYFESPNPDSVLVLMTNKNSVSKNVISRIEKIGRVCIFWPMFQSESERWIISKLNEYGIKAESGAIRYIIELSGTNRNELYSQVDCIINYLSENDSLSLEKAKNIIADLYSYTVFDLCNAMFVKNAKEILKIFRYLINNGEDLVKINFFCNRELDKILKAFSLEKNGYSFSQIKSLLGFRKKEAERIGTIIKDVTINKVCRIYSSAASIDYTIKSSPKDISIVAFEKFLLSLAK